MPATIFVVGPRGRNSRLIDPIVPVDMISFQKMDVYKASTDFVALVVEVIKKAPRGNAAILDQLKRAAMSVPLNIAEGAGRTTVRDAAHSYAIARGSVMECAAILQVLRMTEVLSEEQEKSGAELLKRQVAMLTKLCSKR